jgi:hypothetical protein
VLEGEPLCGGFGRREWSAREEAGAWPRERRDAGLEAWCHDARWEKRGCVSAVG